MTIPRSTALGVVAVSIVTAGILSACKPSMSGGTTGGGGSAPSSTSSSSGSATSTSSGGGASITSSGSGGATACSDGDTQPCYSGDPATRHVGACTDGVATCAAGQWGPCTGEVLPKPEACNGIDDDCNGLADDNNPGIPPGGQCLTGMSGICTFGTLACEGGQVGCHPDNQPAAAEVCDNGLDDDCNGLVDDGCSTCAHDICAAGAKLDPTCDPCVALICTPQLGMGVPDDYCCDTVWDGLCVQRVRTNCNSLKCPEGPMGCVHTLCSTGAPLTSGCDMKDPAPVDCVSKVCQAHPACCSTGWDASCVAAVPSLCAPYTCN
ncbi:MAG: MopE-related protein [Minicystis sp.]